MGAAGLLATRTQAVGRPGWCSRVSQQLRLTEQQGRRTGGPTNRSTRTSHRARASNSSAVAPRSRVGQQFRSPPVVVALAEQQGGAGPSRPPVHPLGRSPPATKSPKSLRPPPMVEHLAASGRATPVCPPDGPTAAPATAIAEGVELPPDLIGPVPLW